MIRPATPTDRESVRRVVSEAFGEEGLLIGELIDLLDSTGNTRAALVAEVDGGVVGHVQLSRSWVDARERLVEVLVLSPLSVLPSHQRQRLGAELVAAAVAEADRMGAPAVFLEGSPDYYSRLGFVAGGDLGFRRPSPRVPEPAFQVRLLGALDSSVAGPLVYCEPFWSLDCVGLRDPMLREIEHMFDA